MGGLQEIYFNINERHAKIGWLNWFKYLIFLAIFFIPLISAICSEELTTVDFFYYTDHGISLWDLM